MDEISVSVYLHSTLVKYSSDGKRRKESITLARGSSIEDLINFLGIEGIKPDDILLGLNGRVAEPSDTLKEGDKIHLMMPISGG